MSSFNSIQRMSLVDCGAGDSICFRDAMQEVLGRLDWLPEPDAKIHRFHVPGDRSGTKNGWYVMFSDGIAAGVFGSWKTGGTGHWRSREPVDYREANLLRANLENARRQRDAELRQMQEAAAIKAQILWDEAQPASPSHSYLRAKGVGPNGLHQRGGELLVPLIYEGRLVNLQRIASDGTKRFLSGGKVKDCYALLGCPMPGKDLYLCEGWATGASIHECTDAAVACAMNSGNLLTAGKQLRLSYSGAELIIAGDDDRLKDGNPGRTAAEKAAKELGCRVVLPTWTGREPLEFSDFNDRYRFLRGLA